MGSIFDRTFNDIISDKLEMITSRAPVCRSCNLDPVNRLAGELSAHDAGLIDVEAVDAMATAIRESSAALEAGIEALGFGGPEVSATARRLIPVRAE